MRQPFLLPALLLALAASVPARATPIAVPCASTTFSGLPASACSGSYSGNLNGADSELTTLNSLWGAAFAYQGKSDDDGSGPFTSSPSGTTGITLAFDQAIVGEFVIGLKASNQYSYYFFDAGSPISSLTFDTTAGVSVNKHGVAQGLSHAALYVAAAAPQQASAVPAPQTCALLLAGLGWLGVFSRRKAAPPSTVA